MPRSKRAARSRKSDRRGPAHVPVLGIDLGATKVVSGLVDPSGRIVRHSGRQVHSNDGPGGVIRSVARSARAALGEIAPRTVQVGIAVAAQVDPRTGTVVHAPNLGWRDVPLARRLSEELGAPVSVINDARAATLAEWKHGAGIGATDLFCLTLGTGVGGSAVVGGRRCHCPNWGCFEAYVGGWAIAERAQEEVRGDPSAGLHLVSRAGSAIAITAQTVFQAYRAGDMLAGRIVRETERFLADGAVSVVNAFNPSLLIVAGGLVAGMPEFLPVIESAIRARCQPPAAGARVVAAKLGEDASLVGAACVARESARHR